MKTRGMRINNYLLNKTNLYRRACSVIYFVILSLWIKKNHTRIGIAVFHSVIKKVRLVRMAKKLVLLTSGCISLRGINVSMRFEETPANISPWQMPRESVLYNLRRNISRKVYALGDLIILTEQFHPFSHGKGVNLE